MFSKITKLNDYDKVTLIYEPTVQAKEQKSKVVTYLIILLLITVFLLGVNFAFHFLRLSQLQPPTPAANNYDINQFYDFKDLGLPKCPNVKFDYLRLAIRWPPSFCNYAPCKKDADMFNWDIHGLWPDFRNNSYPQFCCDAYKFNYDELKPIASDLETYWQDLKNNGDKNEHGLLEHEWSKHGTCISRSTNPKFGTIFNYFNTTLSLFKEYRVQRWLEANNILPTPKIPYKLSSILNTIESKLGKRINVECDSAKREKENCDNADYSSGKPVNCKKIKSVEYKLLDSIYLCFDKTTLKPIDCPADKLYRTGMCGDDVYYFRLKEDLDGLKN